ncbi:MAG: hypothetical protein M1825_000403 [Sarcosagium campestre]|nr:MAG: hypothetical protein M1825_000403 [Sarcosagium campestre]
MTGFSVPDSSPPSTPMTRGGRKGHYFSGIDPHPSTTPAGPPPSFTPAGPPPSSVFGSSQPRTGDSFLPKKLLFAPTPPRQFSDAPSVKSPFFSDSHQENGSPTSPKLPRRVDRNVLSSLSQASGVDESMLDVDVNGDADFEPDFGSSILAPDLPPTEQHPTNLQPSSSPTNSSEPRGMKRSHRGDTIGPRSSFPQSLIVPPSTESAISSIARGFAERVGPASVSEPDSLILRSETMMCEVHRNRSHFSVHDSESKVVLAAASDQLIKLWRRFTHDALPAPASAEEAAEEQDGLGPIRDSSYIASLLLKLHHPPIVQVSNTFTQSRASRSAGFARSYNAHVAGARQSTAKSLLDWLDTYHNFYPSALHDLRTSRPNATSHVSFWDIIFSALLRGKFEEVINVLKEADFKYAPRGLEDDWKAPNTAEDRLRLRSEYTEVQLGNTRRVINRLINLLEECPAVATGDWDIRGNDWTIFRLKAAQASEDLSTFAEGAHSNEALSAPQFSAENFGIHRQLEDPFSLSQASRKVESKVPWTIYQNLKTLYAMIRGGATEIMSFAQDWVEATIAMTVLWDGETDNLNPVGKTSRYMMDPRDLDDEQAYVQQLAQAFATATADNSDRAFQIDSLNPVEVGLASACEGNIEGAVGIIRSLSLNVASALVEVASAGGWLPVPGPEGMANAFDQSDLMVLSYGQKRKPLSRDSILIEYAEGLFGRDQMDLGKGRGRSQGQGVANGSTHAPETTDAVREGWEIGVQVLGRIDDVELANTKLTRLIDDLQLESSSRVDKLLNICSGIGLVEQSRKSAEKYADTIMENSEKYGDALTYYARAHQPRKLKNVLDLLIAYCLINSIAYPPAEELDEGLLQLITSPDVALAELSLADAGAAHLLHVHLSGYATIRRFYDLRDEGVGAKPHEASERDVLARKRSAAVALNSAIASAQGSIHGGLYDHRTVTIISVDGLLALLGEATMFIDRKYPPGPLAAGTLAPYNSLTIRAETDRVLTLAQTFSILKAVEDLETVHSRIYAQCEDFFRSTLAAKYASRPASPRATLRKSMSSVTASSGFSLVGSFMLGNGRGSGNNGGVAASSIGDSAVLVGPDALRGWDWRAGFNASTATGKDVCRVLRLRIASEVANAWIDGETRVA